MSVQVKEIRQENLHGDVGDCDIEWLCRIADAAERLLFSVDRDQQRNAMELRRLFNTRVTWSGAPAMQFVEEAR